MEIARPKRGYNPDVPSATTDGRTMTGIGREFPEGWED
jgi:hypothetical protein